MSLIPAHFLFRLSYRCSYRSSIPDESGDRLLDLPEACRLDHLPELDASPQFADVRVAWNESGLAVQVEVRGKEKPLQGDRDRPRSADGISVWVDTRDTRNIHRASRFCHQFFFLPTGGGPERDEPAAGPVKINRAIQDPPLAAAEQMVFQSATTRTGYWIEAFLSAAVLNGFDPVNNPRLGFYYAVHDAELGDQTLGVGADFPYWEDPSLWATLVLSKDA